MYILGSPWKKLLFFSCLQSKRRQIFDKLYTFPKVTYRKSTISEKSPRVRLSFCLSMTHPSLPLQSSLYIPPFPSRKLLTQEGREGSKAKEAKQEMGIFGNQVVSPQVKWVTTFRTIEKKNISNESKVIWKCNGCLKSDHWKISECLSTKCSKIQCNLNKENIKVFL